MDELRRLIAAARSDKWRPEMRRYLWKDALPAAIQAMLARSFPDEDASPKQVVAFLRECVEDSVGAIEDDRAEEAAILASVLVPGARLYQQYGQPSGADTSHVEEERALRRPQRGSE